MQDPCTKNYKSLLREIKENLRNGDKYYAHGLEDSILLDVHSCQISIENVSSVKHKNNYPEVHKTRYNSNKDRTIKKENQGMCAGIPQEHPQFWWCIGRLHRTLYIVVHMTKIYYSERHKAESAGAKGTWVKAQRKSCASFQESPPWGVTQGVLKSPSNELWQHMQVLCPGNVNLSKIEANQNNAIKQNNISNGIHFK